MSEYISKVSTKRSRSFTHGDWILTEDKFYEKRHAPKAVSVCV